jgi:cell division protease FtsH
MVTKYGMSDKLGPILYGGGDQEVFIGRDMGHVKDYSEKTASAIDEEIYSIISNAYKKTENILKSNMEKLHEVAQYLIKYEKMSGEDFSAMMDGTFVYPVEEAEE